MKIESIVLPPVETNCYIVTDEASGEALVIDPGTPEPALIEALEAPGRRIVAILNTHGHIDHIAGNACAKETTGAPLYIHPADEPMLADAMLNGAGWLGLPFTPSAADHRVEDGQRLALGPFEIEVLHCPGHSPGHVAYRIGDDFFGGDFVFAGSIGRTDLPGADPRVMSRSLREVFLPLPDGVRIHPGHGPSTTVAAERRSNPFIRAIQNGRELF